MHTSQDYIYIYIKIKKIKSKPEKIRCNSDVKMRQYAYLWIDKQVLQEWHHKQRETNQNTEGDIFVYGLHCIPQQRTNRESAS